MLGVMNFWPILVVKTTVNLKGYSINSRYDAYSHSKRCLLTQ